MIFRYVTTALAARPSPGMARDDNPAAAADGGLPAKGRLEAAAQDRRHRTAGAP